MITEFFQSLAGEKMGLKRLVAKVEDINYTQLSQKELQQIFETTCDSDFQALREFCRYDKKWIIIQVIM